MQLCQNIVTLELICGKGSTIKVFSCHNCSDLLHYEQWCRGTIQIKCRLTAHLLKGPLLYFTLNSQSRFSSVSYIYTKVLGIAFCLCNFTVTYYCQGIRFLRFLIKMQSLFIATFTLCVHVRRRRRGEEEKSM